VVRLFEDQGEMWDPDCSPWPRRLPQFVGLFVLGVAIAVAAQQHEFSRPNFALVLLAVILLPWALDCVTWRKTWLHDRRFHPALLVAWSLVVLVAANWLTAKYGGSYNYSPFFTVLLVGEMAGTAGPRFGALVGVGAIAGLITIVNVDHFAGMAIWCFAFVITWLGGSAIRHQVMYAFELTQAQSELAARAAEDERHRLARDVHDLIAHSLAVTMLQISGARLALQAGEADEAMAALQDAETAGRSAMAEIHRTVGLLGSSNHGEAPPTPSATDLPSLVESFQSAGLQVDFILVGQLDLVPLAVGLASYRVVQESLSNAVKHAPGVPVYLRIEIEESGVAINITNPVVPGRSNTQGGGNGVRGMAERAELLGGSVAAHNGDGTWKVQADIPWETVPA
jgi:signal transduction histidine kinase